MIRIDFVEPEEERSAGATGSQEAASEGGDAQALAAVEAALGDLLARALPAGSSGSASKPAPARRTRKAGRRVGRRKLAAPRGVPLRDAMLLAFGRILSTARGTVRHAASDPEHAVHEFRKSVRRARALVSLLRPALGRKAAQGLGGELRRAFQATGSLRDADILIATLRAVDSEDPARAAFERALEQEQSRGGSGAAEALASGCRTLRPLPEVLRVTLPRSFSMDELARGLARSCRRVRSTLDQAAESGKGTDFHAWRKRVKELRYQIELLASSGSAELKRREKALAGLAEDLGKTTDLMVLHAALAERVESGLVPEAPALAETIRAEIASRSRGLLERGKDFFNEAPAEFARRVLAERG